MQAPNQKESPILELDSVSCHYGDALALSDVSLTVPPGLIVSILGVNGAGKTTVLRVMSGIHAATSGTLRVKGEVVDKMSPSALVRRGIAHSPEGRRIFPYMTVQENLQIGAYTVRDNALILERLEQVYSIFPILKERTRAIGQNLSGGQQQMLAIGRAMMSGPDVLLLDEPTLGLAPKIIGEVADNIVKMRENGVTVVLVEQNAEIALELADYVYVMAHGKIILGGVSDDISQSKVLKEAYFGV